MMLMNVWLGGIGVLSQLEAEVPIRGEIRRWVPGFDDADLAQIGAVPADLVVTTEKDLVKLGRAEVLLDRGVEAEGVQEFGGLTIGFIAFDLLVIVGHELVVLEYRQVVGREILARHVRGATGVLVAIAEVEQQRRRLGLLLRLARRRV